MTTTLTRPSAPTALRLPAPPTPAAGAAGVAVVSPRLRPRGRPRRLPRLWRGLGWLATAVVGVLAIGIALLAALPAIDARLLVVTSGSMAPAIAAGDAVVVVDTPPEDVAVDDVIAFHGYGSERLTTHRAISRHDVDGRLHFRTQGDANATPDANLAPAGGVVGKVVLTLPQAGRPLLALTSPTARMLLLVLPAAVIAALEIRELLAGRSQEPSPPARPWSIPCARP